MNGWSCSPKHGPAHFTVLKQLFVRMIWSFLKIINCMARPRFSKHGPVPFTVLKNLFCLDVMQPFWKHSSWWLGRSPTSPVTAQLILRRWSIFSSWCFADYLQRSNERLVVLLQTRSSSYHGVESTFRPNGVKFFKNIQNLDCIVLPQTRPSSFHGFEKLFGLDVMQPFQKHSSWWLGRAPQHPLSRPSSFCGVKHLFVLMLCRFSTTFKWTAGRAPSNTVQFKSRCSLYFSSGWHETF